jgi:GT2 family glycosyltransferase
MAAGEYIALMDNDDEITPDALYEVVKVINEKDADFIYSDEDKLDKENNHILPFFKPDFSYDLLLSLNYITHFSVIRKAILNDIKGFRLGYEGAQDYDLFLRVVEKTNNIVHIPKILYSWRMLETSTALSSDAKPYAHEAGRKAIESHFARSGISAEVETSKRLFTYPVKYAMPKEYFKISIIIPTKDGLNFLKTCVESILTVSTYNNFEILILNNNSEEEETFKWFDYIQGKYENIKVIDANYEFNWSKLNNHGMRESKGDVFIFLNNDIKVITPDWLERLAGTAIQPNVGTVGALLLFEDDTIQHAGVVLGMNGWADHVYRGMEQVHLNTPFVSPLVTRNVLASTGACLAVSKKVIKDIGPFDEEFKICGSDVELSLRAYEKGYRNIFNAETVLYHYESKTRDSFVPECDFEMSKKAYERYWKSGDPFYNKNLSLDSTIPIYRGSE